ncbi:MAG: PAS domain S-box protein [Euryarchaeota archaeon]|nr:PAS domain S-box protein [Euryarchaeota archaeon]
MKGLVLDVLTGSQSPMEVAQAVVVVAMGLFLVVVAGRNLKEPYPFGRPAGAMLLVSGVLAVVWQGPVLLPFRFGSEESAGAAGVLFFMAVPLSVLLFVLTSFSTRLRERKESLETVERQKAELVAAEAHLRSVLENAPDEIAIVDKAGCILSLNHVQDVSDPTILLGRPVFGFLTEESAARFRAALGRVFRSGGGEEIELRISEGALKESDDPEGSAERWYYARIAHLSDEGDGMAIVIGTDITARRAMEQELRQERERFAALSDAAFEGIVIHQDDLILETNQAFADLIGRTRDELIGRRLTALLTDDGENPAGLDDPGEHHQTGRLGHKDGHTVHVEVQRRAITFQDLSMRVTVLRDITTEIEGRRKDRMLRALFGHAKDAIFILDGHDGTIHDCNPAAAISLGLSRDDVIGTRIIQHVAEGGDTADWSKVRASLATQSSIWAETVQRRADGTTFPVELSISTIGDDTHSGGSMLVTVARDISERKRAEEQIAATAKKLRTVIETTNDGIWEWDLLTDRIIWTKLLPAMRTTQGEGPMMSADTFALRIHPEDRAAFGLGAAESRRGSSCCQEGLRVRARDGGWLWVRCIMTPIRDQAGRVVRIVGSMQDITLQKRGEHLQKALERVKEEAIRSQESSRLKSEFLANMSHELRTPLNVIIGFAELLASGKVGALEPRHADFVSDIQKSGHHLLQIINDVLDLAKVEAGKLSLEAQVVDLEALVSEACDNLRNLADEKQIALVHNVDPAIGSVTFDPARYRQVLYNYLTNAIKFTPEGGHVQVHTTIIDDDFFETCVEDDGIGIPKDDLKRLFVPFEQLDPGMDKRYQGTGLGLALTKRIVEAMGGTVRLESTEGEGSRFYATLPLRPPAATPLLPRGQLGVPHVPHVLLHSDDRDERGRARRLLAADGHRVETVAGLDALIAAVIDDPADLLVIDPVGLGPDADASLDRIMAAAGPAAILLYGATEAPAGLADRVQAVLRHGDGPEALRDAVRNAMPMPPGSSRPAPAEVPDETTAETERATESPDGARGP